MWWQLHLPRTCQSEVKGAKAELCWAGGSQPVANRTISAGGVQLFVNMQTSVVGFVAVEVVGEEGLSLAEADPLKGSAINAVASWGHGATASLSRLAGKEVAFKVAMADAKLFSLRLGCAAA
jgi:hypothetical protein